MFDAIRSTLAHPYAMRRPAPTERQALSFYGAALATARLLDHESDQRVLDADADAAWRAYGSDLPTVIRCDLVLKNFAMLYPAAFAPGPVFGLSGWYDDDPWGAGFERPPPKMVEALFAKRSVAADAGEALDQALFAWGLAGTSPNAALAAKLSASTNVVVAGARAMAQVARAFVAGERLSARTQVIVVGDRPETVHALGIACALLREAGVPLLANGRRADDESWAKWAEREKDRLGVARARILVTSDDALPEELEAGRALAAALGAEETLEIAET